MEAGADWVRIKVDGDALFESGEYRVREGAGVILDEIGDLANEFDGTIIIEGHTDTDGPANSRFNEADDYLGNYELGALRAVSVLDYLVRQKNVDRQKLVPLSHGGARPRETNDLTEGKARNRRVEFEFRAGAEAHNDDIGNEIKPGDQ
nr:OmpA family protein [Acanthopleuribacter pedis]